ncbi:MAG: hypothetical protein FD168_138 [Desulfobulbaceae bacterium]|nr:MAG: hypothetical protein FD168_138 [Desulfobulbaceae bacterium]
MKKVLSTVVALGCCLYLPSAVLAGGGKKVSDDMSREMSDLRAQLAKQQAEIDMLKGQKSDPTLATRLDALEKKKGYVMAGNAFIDGVTLTGDLRERFQTKSYNFYNDSDASQDGFSTRFRLGGVWQNKAENWTIGAGIATNIASANRSPEDAWGGVNEFDHSEINLDYAYAKHTFGDYAVILGQSPVPYTWSWIFWDSDLRPQGATVAYGKETGIFAVAGAYGAKVTNIDKGDLVDDVYGENTGLAYIGQVGYKDKFSEKGKYTLAAGYHMVDQAYMNEIARSTSDLGGYSVEVGDLYGDVSFPVGPVDLKLYGQGWLNFAADSDKGVTQSAIMGLGEDAEGNDMGWSLGLSGKMDQVRFAYSYSVVEADSIYGGYVDIANAVAGTTNVQGHKAGVGYDVTKNWALDFTYYNFENIEDAGVTKLTTVEDVQTYQFDVTYKF